MPSRQATQPPIRPREIWAWALFDFANSSYTTVIITVVYSVYFTKVVAEGQVGEQLWGWGYSASMLAIAFMSPFLGAVADFAGAKKRFLCVLTGLSVVFTALLYFVGSGDVWMGLLFLVLSNIGFAGGLTFYNGFLPEIARADNMGRISGYGWALGYVGGLVSLLAVFPFVRGGFGEENLSSVRWAFPLTAVFFFLASLPTFFFLRERALPGRLAEGEGYWRVGWRRVFGTLREIRRFRELVKFFIAFFIYGDAINTVIVFSAIFAAHVLGFSPGELIVFFVVVQVTAALGAFAFGPVTDRLGAKRTIGITLVIWIGVVAAAVWVETKEAFYVVGLVAGLAIGSSQAASRALIALMTPPGKSAEFFGFFALTEKFAAIMGPLVYGTISAWTGSQRTALLSVGAFFVLGFVALQFVQEKEGISAARETGLPCSGGGGTGGSPNLPSART